MKTVVEPQRAISVLKEVDVAVVGGGASGICAAIASARNGASTLLIESWAYPIGYICSIPGCNVTGICFQNTNSEQIVGGIATEMVGRLTATGDAIPIIEREVISDIPFLHTPYGRYGPVLDLEAVKTLALEMLEESKCDLLLRAMGAGAIVEENVIKGVYIQSKSGRQAVLAKMVVDCTGDGDIAAWAGAPFDKAPRDQLYQMGNSLDLANVDKSAVRAESERILREHKDEVAYLIRPRDPDKIPSRWEVPLIAALHGPGGVRMTPDGRGLEGKRRQVGWTPRRGMGRMSADYEGDATDIVDLTRAEVTTRKALWARLQNMRATAPGYAQCIPVPDSLQLGVRETRRIMGGYVLTGDDVQGGRKFDDAIARSADPIDGHLPGGGWDYHEIQNGHHEIPYRCLVPLTIDNLLVAGRCISADHRAESSIRKIPPCMATGQAAGTAAALALREGTTPRKLDVELLQDTLKAQGA